MRSRLAPKEKWRERRTVQKTTCSRAKARERFGAKKSKTTIKRVYTITDRDRELIKELNLKMSDFVLLDGHELQHVLHREFIGIAGAISDTRTVTVGSITGQDWTELLGSYLDTGMQVNKMGNCAQASQIADFCWTVTAGLGEIVLGVGEGIWQGGKNVAHMILHPLDTAYGAGCALGVMLVCCGKISMAIGDPDLPIDNEYSTFQRAHDPARADYLLHVYDTMIAQAKQAKQATARDIARGVSTMATEAILTAKLSSAAVKCITSINSRVPGALHRALSCAPETAESFVLADGGHVRFSKNALQALAESEAAEARAATLMREGAQSEKVVVAAESCVNEARAAHILEAEQVALNAHKPLENVHTALMSDIRQELTVLRPSCDSRRKGFGEFSNKYLKFEYEHMFGMDLKNLNKGPLRIGGFHLDPMSKIEKSGLFHFRDKVVLPTGVYKADLIYKGEIVKRNATFFPAHWSREKVINKIYEAYDNFIGSGQIPVKARDGKYTICGFTSEGIEIEMHITQKGWVNSAYPIVK